MKQLLSAAALAATVGLGAAAQGATFSAGESIAAGGIWTSPLRPAAPRVYQYVLPASTINYSGSDPVLLTGLSMRLSHQSTAAGATALNSGGSTGRYEIMLSRTSVAPGGQLSTTFANNVAPGTAVTVRTGALVIPPNDYPVRTSATDAGGFGSPFVFNTPYTYNPGEEILVTIRHTGFTYTDPQEGATPATDAFSSTLAGQWDYGAIANTTDPNATTGTRFTGTNATVTQFTYTAVPEPAGLALLGVAGLLCCRRRRA